MALAGCMGCVASGVGGDGAAGGSGDAAAALDAPVDSRFNGFPDARAQPDAPRLPLPDAAQTRDAAMPPDAALSPDASPPDAPPLPDAASGCVPGPVACVSGPPSAARGGQLNVRAFVPAASARDWVGLFQPGASAMAYYAWFYTSTCGSIAGSQAVVYSSCDINLPLLSPGSYELRLYADDTYAPILASSPIQITP
jgi:hypothetical protein